MPPPLLLIGLPAVPPPVDEPWPPELAVPLVPAAPEECGAAEEDPPDAPPEAAPDAAPDAEEEAAAPVPAALVLPEAPPQAVSASVVAAARSASGRMRRRAFLGVFMVSPEGQRQSVVVSRYTAAAACPVSPYS